MSEVTGCSGLDRVLAASRVSGSGARFTGDGTCVLRVGRERNFTADTAFWFLNECRYRHPTLIYMLCSHFISISICFFKPKIKITKKFMPTKQFKDEEVRLTHIQFKMRM